MFQMDCFNFFTITDFQCMYKKILLHGYFTIYKQSRSIIIMLNCDISLCENMSFTTNPLLDYVDLACFRLRLKAP